MSLPKESKVQERMAENPGMDYLTAYRAEQSFAVMAQRLQNDRNHQRRVYAKW